MEKNIIGSLCSVMYNYDVYYFFIDCGKDFYLEVSKLKDKTGHFFIVDYIQESNSYPCNNLFNYQKFKSENSHLNFIN